MPLFEYTCSECGREFEELVGASATDTPCPYCGSLKTERKLSAFACSGPSSGGGSCSAPAGSGFR